MATKRIKTDYKGIYYREVPRIGGKGTEKIFYAVYKKNGVVVETKIGGQFKDRVTASYASRVRSDLIEGRRLTRKQVRVQEKAAKEADEGRWTVDKLWRQYLSAKPNLKGLKTDENRYQNHIKPVFGDRELSEIIPLDLVRLEKKLSKKLSPQTARHVLELLRRLSNFAVRMNLCPGLSFKIEMPRVNNIKIEDLAPEQLSDLLKVLHEHQGTDAADMMLLALYSGVRRGEMFRLKWNDVDVERGFIRLRDPKGGVDS
ncbi:MAG: site-specific integrase, partial [Desulfobacterales bacterium]